MQPFIPHTELLAPVKHCGIERTVGFWVVENREIDTEPTRIICTIHTRVQNNRTEFSGLIKKCPRGDTITAQLSNHRSMLIETFLPFFRRKIERDYERANRQKRLDK